MRVSTGGKSFLLGDSPFRFRGLRYRLRPDAPERAWSATVQPGLDRVAAAGYTVLNVPPLTARTIEQAVPHGLRFMLEFDGAALDVLSALPRRAQARGVRDTATRIRRSVQQWDGSESLVGIVVDGPALLGQSRPDARLTRRIADELAIALHDEEPELLAAWRTASPLDGECPPEFDFLIAGFELSHQDELEPALMSCHRQVGDRPLVLGEVAVARAEAPGLEWLIDAGLWCGVAGTVTEISTRSDAGLHDAEMARLQRRTVRDLHVAWPAISVVVNAYNAEATLRECLRHCGELDYPDLEVIVVDDGSTDATPEIARGHQRTRLITIPHSGLAAGRNVGFRAARGELVAYLDADAYPSREWPWYLALASFGERLAGSGGPNVPPQDEPRSAKVVARSPGGPVPQLHGPTRAIHTPGCNMAFSRRVLEQLHGFDPVIEGAEDIEFEWRVLDSGCEIGYHPAALVWHHRRPGLGAYLRQQSHYGCGQAILERRHPERFPTGYRVRRALDRLFPRRRTQERQSSYVVEYLTLPHADGAVLEIAHQWGMPTATLLICTAPLAIVRRKLGVPAAVAAAFVGTLFGIDIRNAGRGRRRSERTLLLRTEVAAVQLLRPLAFRWGHVRGRRELRHTARDWPPRPGETGSPGTPYEV